MNLLLKVIDDAWHETIADWWRGLVMVQLGLALFFLVWCVGLFRKLPIDPKDRQLRPLAGLAVAFFLMALFVSIEVAGRFGRNLLSWRTPLASVALGVFQWSLYKLFTFLRRTTKVAAERNATVKATVVDTSKPGANIDLDDMTEVKNGHG